MDGLRFYHFASGTPDLVQAVDDRIIVRHSCERGWIRGAATRNALATLGERLNLAIHRHRTVGAGEWLGVTEEPVEFGDRSACLGNTSNRLACRANNRPAGFRTTANIRYSKVSFIYPAHIDNIVD